MLENEFRYLNATGTGTIDFSYLADDESNELDAGDDDFRQVSLPMRSRIPILSRSRKTMKPIGK